MKNKLSFVATVVLMVLFISCKEKKEEEVTKAVEKIEVEEVKIKKDCTDVKWAHQEGANGPANWKDLCVGFSDCDGKVQSPINIVTANVSKEGNLLAPKFSYKESSINIVNNGHTIQFNVDGENNVNLNGKDYKLLQFHYHAKSEHTIDGKYYPLEVHFVHQHSATEYAVLGMMFEEGKENKLLSEYLDKFPTSKGEFKSKDMMDVLSLFPSNKSYFNYQGSLTTPPCSEVVNWHLLKTPLTASKAQLEQFSKILNNNYRPIMPLNGRVVGQSN